MNNIVSMVNYYLVHKNADDSIVYYLKNKLDNAKIDELIIIQIELLFTDPSDKLVSELVNYINNKINDILKNITLFDLASLIGILKHKEDAMLDNIKKLEERNKDIFAKIQTKDLNLDQKFDDIDSKIAANLINESQTNTFNIGRSKSEINSINIWLVNLENSFDKKINSVDIEELLVSYINELTLINRDDFINKYISKTSSKIDEYILNSNLLDTITNVIPELDRIYNANSKYKNELFKLLDYYIDLVDSKVKLRINSLDYEEKLILRDKINIICREILSNNNPDDDFKVLVINSYLKYL